MRTLVKAAVQGATCGLAIGLVLLVGGRLWRLDVTTESVGTKSIKATNVEAHAYYLVDKDGRRKGEFKVNNASKTTLALWSQEDVKITLSTQDSDSEVNVSARGGEVAARLSASARKTDEFGLIANSALFLINRPAGVGTELAAHKKPLSEAGQVYLALVDELDSEYWEALAGGVRVGLELDTEKGPSLALSDTNGKERAVIGSTSLETVKTGDTITRSESSLVLFDKDGKVIWEAP